MRCAAQRVMSAAYKHNFEGHNPTALSVAINLSAV